MRVSLSISNRVLKRYNETLSTTFGVSLSISNRVLKLSDEQFATWFECKFINIQQSTKTRMSPTKVEKSVSLSISNRVLKLQADEIGEIFV